MEKAALAGYTHVARMVYERPWAILPATLAVIEEVVRLRLDGYRFTEDEIAERLGNADRLNETWAYAAGPLGMMAKHTDGGFSLVTPASLGMWAAVGQAPPGTPGALAVIPLSGVLMPKANVMSALSGGTSLEQFQARFRDALNSPDVAGILIDVDSPGGSVALVPETADMVYAARDQKPVVAIANTMAASAAYYIASQAEEVYSTPSGEVGSIGVLMAHDDISGMAEQMGVKRTYISTPQYKTEGNPYGPLSEETMAYFQGEVDAVYDEFVSAVAIGRGTSMDAVTQDMGQGRMLRAADAYDANMIDGIATFDQAVVRLSQMTRGARGTFARSEFRHAIEYGKTLAIDTRTEDERSSAEARVWVQERFGSEARVSGECSCGRNMSPNPEYGEYSYEGGTYGRYVCHDCGARWTVDLNGAMWPEKETPALQVADAGEAGGTAAKRARLRGRRIES